MESAEGLEFPVVYLLATGASFRPPFDGESEQAAWTEQMGRCFYVAMTREQGTRPSCCSRPPPVSAPAPAAVQNARQAKGLQPGLLE